jgi:hypothetical protein
LVSKGITSDDLLKTIRKPMVDAGLPAQLKTHRNANDFGVGFLKQIAKALAHGS